MLKPMLALLGAVAALAAPSTAAAAADTTVAPDPAAGQLTALDGTVVWVSGAFGSQVLMQQTAAGDARIPGAPRAKAYRTVDLGHDADGGLVLSYLRCSTAGSCVARQDDLRGRRASFRGLTPTRCSLTTAPAVWRTRVAYGATCRTTSGRLDTSRSGLYVRTGSGAPRRLPLPADAVKFDIRLITSVDLRGTRVAAVAADVYEYVFSETVGGGERHSFLAAASEGDSDEHTTGLALASASVVWSLTDAEHAGDPNTAVIQRLTGGCLDYERLANPTADDSGFRATDLAVDGSALYLTVPGTGIVSHAFTPERPCT